MRRIPYIAQDIAPKVLLIRRVCSEKCCVPIGQDSSTLKKTTASRYYEKYDETQNGCRICATVASVRTFHPMQFQPMQFQTFAFQPITISTYCIFNNPQFRPKPTLINGS